jgi:general stress protein 26
MQQLRLVEFGNHGRRQLSKGVPRGAGRQQIGPVRPGLWTSVPIRWCRASGAFCYPGSSNGHPSLNATHRLLLQGGPVDRQQFINFVRERGLAVLATRGADGAPQAALVGITATGRGELVFDTNRGSRKYRNLSAFAQVALVIGWDNEMTVQCEGAADIPTGADRDRCLQAYFAQYPDGVERAHDPDIVHVRVRPSWLRYSHYRPESFTVEETTVGH